MLINKRIMIKWKMVLNKYSLALFFIAINLVSLHWTARPSELKAGYWRATIDRPDGKQIVFNFESKVSAGKSVIYVINAGERLLVDSIEIRGDSVIIEMPFFESGFRAKVNADGNLQGIWVKNYGKLIQTLPFNAEYNVKQRFKVSSPAVANISGRWSTYFKGKDEKVSTITGEFKQTGSHVTGTFLDPTGDYRFLEGVVSHDSLKLSGFDGGHAFLFTAKIDNKNKISDGKFYSGAKSTSDWYAERNAHAPIPDGYGESNIRKGAGKLNFSFPDMNDGHLVSITDKVYQGKVVVIQILGSWCPNCMDETKFLSEFYQKDHAKGVEIIGLAYERTTDFASSQKALQAFKKRFDIQYPILITGVTVSDSLRTEKTLPQLKKIDAFPTTIFIDKKGNIREVYSGFNGPATGEHYAESKKEFNETIDKLLAE
jgi:thiol-disulfide isomerase/thioredoxin